jgi:alkylated DNA nucleotide flippase Atl1
MADVLMSGDGDLARYVNQINQCDMSVTRNVMRNVTVGALVSVWGVVRHKGKRVDDDLVLAGLSVSVIDDIADLAGFGEAMSRVGWVVEDDNGLVFPSFFGEFNVDPAEEQRKKNAERQRKYRETHSQNSNVTRNVTVTPKSNIEKRREEKSNRKNSKEISEATKPSDVADKVWSDWLAHRKAKRSVVTDLVVEQHRKAAKEKGWKLEDALVECMARGWTGLKAEWLDMKRSPVVDMTNDDWLTRIPS